ncbi:MAG: glycine cleavage system protein H [Planctomycetota bacterium]
MMTFAMGEFTAEFPTDYLYASNHMWARTSPDQSDGPVLRFGLTAYAVRLLQDVYFLDWVVEPGMNLAHRRNIGAIESKKAESDLFSPLEGVLTNINDDVLAEPSLINADTYNRGWMFEIRSADTDGHLMDVDAYRLHLESAWKVAQRTIRGQANQ